MRNRIEQRILDTIKVHTPEIIVEIKKRNTALTKQRLYCYCYDNELPAVRTFINGVDGKYEWVDRKKIFTNKGE